MSLVLFLKIIKNLKSRDSDSTNWPECFWSGDVSRLFCFSRAIAKKVKVKVKVKCTLAQALRLCTGRTAHRGSRGIALPFRDHGTRRGEGSASRPGRSLPPGKTRYPLYRKLGGPQGRSGQVRKISPPTGIRSPDRPARSQSLYRLSYRPTIAKKKRCIFQETVSLDTLWPTLCTEIYVRAFCGGLKQLAVSLQEVNPNRQTKMHRDAPRMERSSYGSQHVLLLFYSVYEQ